MFLKVFDWIANISTCGKMEGSANKMNGHFHISQKGRKIIVRTHFHSTQT